MKTSLSDILMAAKLSEAIYQSDDAIDAYLQKPIIEAAIKALLPDATKVTLASVKGSDFVVAITPQCAWVIYRGTSDAADIFSDIDFRKTTPVWASDWKCANGFSHAFEVSIPRLLDLVGEAKNVRLTGHSLAGGLILLASLYLKEKAGKHIQKTISFCAPRVFTAAGAKYYNNLMGDVTERIVNPKDLVPLMPPLFLGYRDTATASYTVELSPDNWVLTKEIPAKTRAYIFLQSIWVSIKKPGIQSIGHHSVSRMRKILEGIKIE